ncbi:MAG: ABC transporter substrate-binding protein [Hyphomicrobiaceae bacterium]
MASLASPALVAMRWLGLATVFLMLAVAPVRAADPAVAFMERVARELLASTRAKSPALIASVVHRYADTGYIGRYSLGNYRQQLTATEQPGYLAGMVRFIGRYAATESPKYPVASYRITGSTRGAQGIMVDSVITLRDGSSYDVRWLVVPRGGSFRVRDAMVYGFWMTPFLKKLFESYIAENGGHVRALVAVLSR